MAQQARFGQKYFKAFVSGFFVAVPVTVTVLDRLAYVARVEGASMQPSLNPDGGSASDVVLLNRWSVRNYRVQRGDVVSVLSPKNPQQKIIKRVIALEGDFIKTLGYKNRYVRVPDGHLWIEGDHHGHSFDSNSFGPVSQGLLHGRASHIIWPPNRWQRIEPYVPTDRKPLLNWSQKYSEDEDD
ncbi:mitochondrial inner membrane protease subunit 2 [Clupea harengus]|uniref:Mitochondrial inner membrane protease subunit 2 n=1 Tax=Clupea harengus TaxID=7950 RepID=A0A8M1KGA5_CLUHA|nr:mitochondrial inner membrane protease subunit 2 [Clupea harengus]XP_042561543.1 mitochondrial inner membrane protease subunit 2 [Clupea harengus]XP_042561544.1 mitochondrial inner membrane protease subunit 2 [Clupea harengus]XP_042561545.1 mitochondrial inner membrane protease subunit 2 [Clupea harengus]XP_042561546.1 mitochondrial inner membrane protease subunit 2 [Clupea harengus]